MKLAFVHCMRTGGTYAGELFIAATGLPVHCNWRRRLERDFLRGELLVAAAVEDGGMLHNHAVNWDAELHHWCQDHGWRSFAIVRDPCDQLVSLWHYCRGEQGTGATLDQFLIKQSAGGICAHLDFHYWALPEWWPQIDVLIPYAGNLGEQLVKRLGLPAFPHVPLRNERRRYCSPSDRAIDAVRQSGFFETYLDALEKCT